MRPLRITYLITDLKIGGVPLHLYRLATGMPRAEARVRVVSLADEGPVGRRLREAGIEVRSCYGRSARDVRALARLHGILREQRTDILHTLLFHANIAGRAIGPLAGIPSSRIICEIQTVEYERPWHLVADGITCRWCRFEVGNSPAVVSHLARKAHVPVSRLRCVWGGVDVAAIELARPADRAAFGLAADARVILWVGRLDPVKGFEEMLGGLSKFPSAAGIHLLLVGEGPYRSRVEAIIREMRLSDRVTMLGQRDDVAELLKMSDAFVLASRTEGMPNSLAEAMAAALPVVVTDIPGCRDLVKHGETGLLVRARSPDAIARGIEQVIACPESSRAMGRRAAAWVRSHLDHRALPERWLRIYRSL